MTSCKVFCAVMRVMGGANVEVTGEVENIIELEINGVGGELVNIFISVTGIADRHSGGNRR